MDSTSTFSPPISCARAARSVVAVMICILLSARAGGASTGRPSASAATTAVTFSISFFRNILSSQDSGNSLAGTPFRPPRMRLERMCPVCAHYEQELKKKFVGIGVFQGCVIPEMTVAVLTTDLAEFTRPIGENTGKTGVRQTGVGRSARTIEAAAERPAAIQAIFGRRVHAESVLRLKHVER